MCAFPSLGMVTFIRGAVEDLLKCLTLGLMIEFMSKPVTNVVMPAVPSKW